MVRTLVFGMDKRQIYTRPVKAGDRVRIKNYAEKFNGEIGTVDSRDGAYVYVFIDSQPDNTEYPFELYECEVELCDTLSRAEQDKYRPHDMYFINKKEKNNGRK